MLQQWLLKDNFASDIDYITEPVLKEAFCVDEAALFINELVSVVLLQNWLAARVHLNIAEDAVDIETREWEDLREFAVLELRL